MQIELRKTMSPRNENVDVGYFKILQDGYLILKDLDADVVYSAYIKGSGIVSLGEQSYTINSNWQRVILYDTSKDEPMIKFSAGEYYIYENQEEEGNKATDWTPSNEDVDDAINSNSEHISRVEQTADKVEWLIKDGTSEANMVLTSSLYKLIAENIDLTGKVTFNSFNKQLQDDINGKADASDIFAAGTTEIDGGKIKTNSIEADSIDTEDLFAKNINFTGKVTSKSKTIDFEKDITYPDRLIFDTDTGGANVYYVVDGGTTISRRYGVTQIEMDINGLNAVMQEYIKRFGGGTEESELRKIWYGANGIFSNDNNETKHILKIMHTKSTEIPYWLGCGDDVLFDADYISAKKNLFANSISLNGTLIDRLFAEKRTLTESTTELATTARTYLRYHSDGIIKRIVRDGCCQITLCLQTISLIPGYESFNVVGFSSQYKPSLKSFANVSIGNIPALFTADYVDGYTMLSLTNLSSSSIQANQYIYATITYAVD